MSCDFLVSAHAPMSLSYPPCVVLVGNAEADLGGGAVATPRQEEHARIIRLRVALYESPRNSLGDRAPVPSYLILRAPVSPVHII